MKAYKLTTQGGKSCAGSCSETQWGEGIEHTAPGGRAGMCGKGWLHAYRSPGMATMLNIVHADINNPVCWECDADVAEDLSDKLLCTRIKTIRRVDLPELTLEQRVEIAIRAAMVVYDEPSWVTWAQNWLDGTNRSKASAQAAELSILEVPVDAGWRFVAWQSVTQALVAARWLAEETTDCWDVLWETARSTRWACNAVQLKSSTQEQLDIQERLDLDRIISDALRGRTT